MRRSLSNKLIGSAGMSYAEESLTTWEHLKDNKQTLGASDSDVKQETRELTSL